jgi:hypothetical protein
VQHRNGWWLDENGLWTDRLEWAWKPLTPSPPPVRLQQLNIDLTTCLFAPVTLTADPSTPLNWRADG